MAKLEMTIKDTDAFKALLFENKVLKQAFKLAITEQCGFDEKSCDECVFWILDDQCNIAKSIKMLEKYNIVLETGNLNKNLLGKTTNKTKIVGM